MNNPILQTLDSMWISYDIHHHEAVFTVAESEHCMSQITAFHTKNLFLTDKRWHHHLVCIGAHERLSIKNFARHYWLKDLCFGSQEDLQQQLHTSPWSVSIFGMIYQTNTSLYLDQGIIDQPALSRHPNDNTMTVVISHNELQKFLSMIWARYQIVNKELFI